MYCSITVLSTVLCISDAINNGTITALVFSLQKSGFTPPPLYFPPAQSHPNSQFRSKTITTLQLATQCELHPVPVYIQSTNPKMLVPDVNLFQILAILIPN